MTFFRSRKLTWNSAGFISFSSRNARCPLESVSYSAYRLVKYDIVEKLAIIIISAKEVMFSDL